MLAVPRSAYKAYANRQFKGSLTLGEWPAFVISAGKHISSKPCLTFPTKVPVAWALAHAGALSSGKRGLKPTLLRLLSETSCFTKPANRFPNPERPSADPSRTIHGASSLACNEDEAEPRAPPKPHTPTSHHPWYRKRGQAKTNPRADRRKGGQRQCHSGQISFQVIFWLGALAQEVIPLGCLARQPLPAAPPR